MKVGVYLTFDGNCKEAMEYYKGILGGEFDWCSTWGESPMKEKTPKEKLDHIMHCSLPLSKTFNLMGCDRHPEMHKNDHNVGNHVQISLSPESREEADRVHAALSKDGSVGMAMKETFWNSYFGTCIDKYGNQWMFDVPNPSKDAEDLKKKAEALREAAEEANSQATALEKLAGEPASKKAKTDD